MSGRAAILSLAVLFAGQAVLASLSGAEEGKMEDRVTRIEAEGRVRMVQDGRRAVADRAVYERAEEKVVLTGSPKVWEGKNVVSGREITVFLDEDRSEVKDDVRVILYPRDEEKPSKTSKKPPSSEKKKVPLVVTSRSMTADQTKSQIIFENDVVVRRSDMTLTADRVTVFYE